MKTQKKSRFRIEKLEERIAPIVHRFSPVPILENGATEASGGAAGGVAAASHLRATGQISGFPVPENTPGVGPSF